LTADNEWVALSASTESTARRVFQAIGHPELLEDPRFKDNAARVAHRDLVDQIVGDWIRKHTLKEVLDILRSTGAAVAPVYNARDIYEDPHFRERQYCNS
jgi:formyl-CoA transferase